MCNCEYCGKFVKDNPTSKTGHLRVCKKYKETKNQIINSITKEFLLKEYVENERSVGDIANELGLKKAYPITDKLKEFDIYIRTFAEGRKAKGYIEKTKKTCNEKYGADYHTLKSSNKRKEIDNGLQSFFSDQERVNKWKSKLKETWLEKYGAENPLSKDTEIYHKRNKNVLEKYGVNNVFQTQDVIEKSLNTKYTKERVYTQSSKKADFLFSKLLEFADSSHIYCAIKGKEFGIYDNDAKKYHMFDFVNTETKKCIEFNGNYWHANPNKYDAEFFNKKANVTAAQIWERDKIKNNKIIERGFEVKVIWESEFDEDLEKVLNECKEFLYC